MPKKEFLEGKQQITLYPTEAQHKKLKELAEKRGKNLSTYILDSAFRDEKIHEKLDKIIGILEPKTYSHNERQYNLNGSISDYNMKSDVEKAAVNFENQKAEKKCKEQQGEPEIIPAKEKQNLDQWPTANSLDQAIKAAEKIKQNKPKMVQSFMKGGKK